MLRRSSSYTLLKLESALHSSSSPAIEIASSSDGLDLGKASCVKGMFCCPQALALAFMPLPDFWCLWKQGASPVNLWLHISLAHTPHCWSLCWNWGSPAGISNRQSPSAQAGHPKEMLNLGQKHLEVTAHPACLPHAGRSPPYRAPPKLCLDLHLQVVGLGAFHPRTVLDSQDRLRLHVLTDPKGGCIWRTLVLFCWRKARC